jgi:CubicO group peptidase (beta-lactamase class C family)
MRITIITSLILLAFSTLYAQPSNTEELYQKLDKIRQDWKIPGMAIGIVQNDSLIFAEGFGIKNINNPHDSVNSATLFPIASNSKAFTSTAIAMLAKDGKLSFDDKVTQHLPYFKLYDPYVTNNFTIADMLSHRSGLKTFSGDLLWYGSSYSREEVVRKAALLQPSYDFRTKFGYSNIMYIAAGEIIGKASSSSWDAYIANHIFAPLGMQHSYTSFTQVPKSANITSPHNHINDDIISINYLNWDNIGGAGAIISNVEDMGQWLKFQLNNGIWEQDTLVNANEIYRMRTPHVNFTVPYRANSPLNSRHFYGYGLGWTLFDYQGVKVVSHSGGYDGIISYSCIIPEKELGFVILTNANSGLYNALLYTLLDYYLNPESTTDWSALMLRGEEAGRVKESIGKPENKEALTLNEKDYLGHYKCPLYGDAEVYKAKGKLKLKMVQTAIFDGELRHHTGSQFVIKMPQVPSLPEGIVTFEIENNEVKSLKIVIDNPDFHFDEFNFIKQ